MVSFTDTNNWPCTAYHPAKLPNILPFWFICYQIHSRLIEYMRVNYFSIYFVHVFFCCFDHFFSYKFLKLHVYSFLEYRVFLFVNYIMQNFSALIFFFLTQKNIDNHHGENVFWSPSRETEKTHFTTTNKRDIELHLQGGRTIPLFDGAMHWRTIIFPSTNRKQH